MKITKQGMFLLCLSVTQSVLATNPSTGPNNVYIQQIGNSNAITIEQVGGTNNVGGITGTTTIDNINITTWDPNIPSGLNYATIIGNTNNIDISQQGLIDWSTYNIFGNYNNYTSTIIGNSNKTRLTIGDSTNLSTISSYNNITESITGNSNLILQNIIGNYITSNISLIGGSNQITQQLKSSSGISSLNITGDSNILFTEQTDSGIHILTQTIIGSFNSITTQQQGNINTDLNLITTGNNNTITIRTGSSSILNPQSAIAR